MKFSKINEHTLECILTEQEIEDHGLHVDELLKQSTKGQEFMRDILSTAYRTSGYQIGEGCYSVQISFIGDQSVSITFSTGQSEIHEALLHLKKALADNGEYADMEELKKIEALEGEAQIQAFNELFQKIQEPEKQEPSIFERNTYRFAFSSLNLTIDFCKKFSANTSISSELYRDGSGEYYLILKAAKFEKADVCHLIGLASEYADIEQSRRYHATYMQEHFQMILCKDALHILHDL